MAIIKHTSHKSANIFKVVEYYTQIHKPDEKTHKYEPILDKNGLRQERPNCRTFYINAFGKNSDLENWATDCLKTNRHFGKNNTRAEIKTHEFIISFRAEDREKLSWEELEQIAKEYVATFCSGHQALFSIHRDTRRDHIHITINSVRACNRAPADWMSRNPETGDVLNCEVLAGGKFQDSNALKRARNDWMLGKCEKLGLALEDNNKVSDERKEARHSAANIYLRTAIADCVSYAENAEALKHALMSKYGITMHIRGSTLSFQHPDSKKPVRLRTLGIDLPERFAVTPPEREPYIEWITKRRDYNAALATNSIMEADAFIAANEPGKFNRDNYPDLCYLIKQLSGVQSELRTEIDKMDRLISRWQSYLDPQLQPNQRQWHKDYIAWCGCDPDSKLELETLKAGHETASLHLKAVEELRSVLLQTSAEWKHKNEIDKAKNNVEWCKINENKFKQQLRYAKANRRKLAKITYNCQRSALNHSLHSSRSAEAAMAASGTWPAGWENYGKYNAKYFAALRREWELEKKLKESRQKTKKAKKAYKKTSTSHIAATKTAGYDM